jgi:hypothetical protein
LDMDGEYTFLNGALERDDVLPEGALELAESRRKEILADNRRRCPHERPAF